jgi:AraC family transcriptional regulator of adaptative response/methylated-DNA-[protein]-cysteine methyltransferase
MTTNPLLNPNLSPEASHKEILASDAVSDHNWQSVLARDRAQDGVFVFAVSSTGIYCRPSCPAKHPRRTNVTFFGTPDAA